MNKNNKINKIITFVLIGMLILTLSACSNTTQGTQNTPKADDFPNKPIKMIVPFAPGGGSDTLARTLAPHLGTVLKTSIVVENIEGAGTQVGLTNLLSQTADGYVVSQANQPHMSFTINLQGAQYKLSDFAWINIHQIDPITISVLEKAKWNDFKDFIDDIKANPGKVSIGVSQMSGPHIFCLYLQKEYGLNFTVVPYTGGGEGRAALIGGHVDAYFGNAFADATMKGQVRAIGIGWDKRSEIWPDTPTFEEATGDAKLTEVSKGLASLRGFVYSKKFKEQYPERFAKFVQAYKDAYHSEGHMQDAEKTKQLPVMTWIGPEEADKLAATTDKVIQDYSSYFKK